MRVSDAWSASSVCLPPWSRSACIGLLLCLCVPACHFDSQPLFESNAFGDSELGSVTFPDPGRDNRDGGALADASGGPSAAGARGFAGDDAVSGAGRSALDCVPHQTLGCDKDQLLTCAEDGSLQREACGDAGCNAAARRCNVCRPNATRCDADALIRCREDGSAAERSVCDLGCVTTAQGGSACRVCAAGAAMCKDGAQMRCAEDGLSWRTIACAQGCDERTHSCSGALVPTNLPRDACSWTELAERHRSIESDITLNVDDDCPRVVSQARGLPDICVFAFERLEVAKAGVLRLVGSRAVALVSTQAMEIEGRISVSARGSERGPGSLSEGAGVGHDAIGRVSEGTEIDTWTNLPANAGGGGGGYAVPGAPGGRAPGQCGGGLACAESGAGGGAYGAETLVPLVGGSAGGWNSAAEWSTRRSDPGGGGGALQLVACTELRLAASAVIDANGGGGSGGLAGSTDMDSETPGAGAGGGSGGAILLQTLDLRVEPGVVLVANGGGGGGGATRTAAAQEPRVAGVSGQDGRLSANPAAGGKGAGDSMAGGSGGTKELPEPGERAHQTSQAAGGGGGSAGRIRIDSASGMSSPPGIVVSPPATYGTVVVE